MTNNLLDSSTESTTMSSVARSMWIQQIDQFILHFIESITQGTPPTLPASTDARAPAAQMLILEIANEHMSVGEQRQHSQTNAPLSIPSNRFSMNL